MTEVKATIEERDITSEDGLTAYDILRKYPECPIRLPFARSMTQARIDYEHVRKSIIQWYNNTQNKQP
jgi:hypothetical protein